MPRLSELRTAGEVYTQHLADDPELRAGYERTGFAHVVALRVIRYRADHGLSQTALARRLSMKQPAVARLEAGEHEPSLATLARLARALGMEFHIDITPEGFGLRESA